MRFSSFTLPSIALLLTVAAAAPAPADPTSIAPVETPASNATAPAPVEGEDDGKMGIMNFSKSCGGCYMDGARLICKCTTKSNTHRWTETDLAERIGNSRGTLVYNSGGYIKSCWDSVWYDVFWEDEMCATCSEGGAGSGSKRTCMYLGDKIENNDGYMRWV